MALSQTNLAEMKRIYIYFNGNEKGCTAWLNELKSLFPESKSGEGKKTVYNFNTDKIWEIILQNDRWKRYIEKQKIDSYWELSIRATPDEDAYLILNQRAVNSEYGEED